MPFSDFDDDLHRLLVQAFEGAMLMLRIVKPAAVSDERRAETITSITSTLVAAAREGHRDYQTLQMMALDAIE